MAETEETTDEARLLRMAEVDTAARWRHLCDLTADTMTAEEAEAAMAADTLTEGTTDETIARTTEIDVTMADETTTLAVGTDETATMISEGTRPVVTKRLQEGRRDVMQQYSNQQRIRRPAAIRNQHLSLSELQPTVKYPAAKTAAPIFVSSYATFDSSTMCGPSACPTVNPNVLYRQSSYTSISARSVMIALPFRQQQDRYST